MLENITILEDYNRLNRYLAGKYIVQVLKLTANCVSLHLSDGITIDFLQLEYEIFGDINA